MELSVSQCGTLFIVTINGQEISNVKDYRIISSAREGTELMLKISLVDEIMEFATKATK